MRVEIEKGPVDEWVSLAEVTIGTLCHTRPEQDAAAIIVNSSGSTAGGRGVIWIYHHHMVAQQLTESKCQQIKVVPFEDGERLVFHTT